MPKKPVDDDEFEEEEEDAPSQPFNCWGWF